ncbi:MAG: 3-deoxy-8-phosphooctulonate synthase [Rhodobiaceae bacterium]|nr:3-deoxy-8-phosphooctulonate synthase [Rhodobiaceae bacterium]MBT5641428.1 3-deoxy-8-phosphooctulonate synthase [Rhodobiaceae bacterium]
MIIPNKTISLNNYSISNSDPLTLIAGPCALESKQHAIDMACKLNELSNNLDLNFIFKTSFDKANRTSIHSKRGIGLDKALDVFNEIKNIHNIPILTDVHLPEQCDLIKDFVDVIQIPAFLIRQTDLLIAASNSGAIINLKKAQFMSAHDIGNVIEKVTSSGNKNILLTERGTMFGYNNLVVDYRSLKIMKDYNIPVVFDSTHSIQLPGGSGSKSTGEKDFIETLSIAAVSIGLSSIFIETHDNPAKAISDGDNMVNFKDMPNLLQKLKAFDNLAKK